MRSHSALPIRIDPGEAASLLHAKPLLGAVRQLANS